MFLHNLTISLCTESLHNVTTYQDTSERLTLFEEVTCLLPKFNTFGKNTKVDILLNGFQTDNTDWFQLNINLQIKVQKYILKTKRFHNPSETE